MKHLTATLLLIFSVFLAGPSAADPENPILSNEELVYQSRLRMAEGYTAAIQRVALSLAEALREDRSGQVYDHLSVEDDLEGLKTLGGFDRSVLSLTDAEIDSYTRMGVRAAVSDQSGTGFAGSVEGELVVFAAPEDWRIGDPGPLYLRGGVTPTMIFNVRHSYNSSLVGQVDDGFFNRGPFRITRVRPHLLSAVITIRLPTQTAAAFIPLRAGSLEASTSITREKRRLPCAEGFHGSGLFSRRETQNSINGFGVITPNHGPWDQYQEHCEADTTRNITKTDICPNQIGKTWYRITEIIRKDADDPLITERFLDPETKNEFSNSCYPDRKIRKESTYTGEDEVKTCADVYPATPAWEGDVTYERIITLNKRSYVDDPSNMVENEVEGDWEITRETCSRLISKDFREHKLLECLPPYLETGGAWREYRILRKTHREHKNGQLVPISATRGDWRPDSNSCRNVVTRVFGEYKTESGPCTTYTYVRSVTQITTSYQDGRPDGVITRPGGWVSVGSTRRDNNRRLLKHGDHGGGYNDKPCGGSSGGGNSGGGNDRGGDSGSDHHSRDGHSGHGEHPDGNTDRP